MKFKKAIVAVILAGSMLTMTACDAITDNEKEKETTYTVNLVLNGGSVENKLTSYVEGKGATLPTPSMNGYNFDGWYESSSGSGTPVTSISSTDTGAKTFYAKWSLKTYSVTLNYDGGTSETEVTSYTYRTGATLPADVTKTGHTFKGWYDNSTLTGDEVTSISETDTGDKEFWASWQANTYQIQLYLNDGKLVTDTTTVTSVHTVNYTYGQGYNLPTTGLTRDGYKFIGWHKAANLKDGTVTTVSATQTGDLKFYAEWKETIGNVSLHPNGGTIIEGDIEKYQQGVETTLTNQVTKANYDFAGWYDNASLTGDAYEKIPATATGDLNFYAKWKPKTYTVTLNLNGGTSVSNNLTKYSYGTGATLPTTATRNGYTFIGWYTSASGGTKVTSISSTDTGNKTYYAQWQIISSSDLTISASGGYAEGLFVEIPKVSGLTNSTDYTVKYKLHSESDSAYKTVDSNLVRLYADTNIVRADMVGIKAGQYDVQVTANNKAAVKENITVTAQDRSGYAHFNATSGVGGYNNDGTPKDDAYIIYVNESNKNDVVAPWNSKKKGIAYVLSDLSNAKKPVIVRIVGKISAATWDKDNWTTLKAQYEAAEKTSDGKKIKNDSSIVGINGKKLPTSSSDLTQEKLISGGYNKLQTDITELKGLSSKATYSQSSSESGYDSCWNNCSISDASNVTVEGIGTDAELFQWGMTWSKCKSIEVRNLTFDDYTEDACSFEGSDDSTTISGFTHTRFWIHNCTFNQGINYWDVCAEQDKREGDGATDFKRLAYVTVAYNHYYNNHKTGLVGADDKSLTANVTFHHNYYEICQSRLPLARRANMHMYNNYYYGTTNTCLSIRSGGYAFVEYCCFEDANNPIEVKLGTKKLTGESDYLWGFVKVFNCNMINSSWTASTYIKETSDRTKKYANDNIYNQYFDTDASDFYYDSVNKKSNVTNLITDTSQISTLIPQQAGVLKPAD